MLLNSAISIAHWSRWERGSRRWVADIASSQCNLLGHLYVCWELRRLHGAGGWACASIAFFAISAKFEPRRRAMRAYDVRLLLPHAAFRFCGFWTVATVDGAGFDRRLSAFYGLSILLLGLPTVRMESCLGGVRQYLLWPVPVTAIVGWGRDERVGGGVGMAEASMSVGFLRKSSCKLHRELARCAPAGWLLGLGTSS